MPTHRVLRQLTLANALLLCAFGNATAQTDRTYSLADSLRGSLTSPDRTWWDVIFYDLHVKINPADSTIRGHNAITYRVVEPSLAMQIDLQEPLEVDSITQDGASLFFRQTGNAYFVRLASPQPVGSTQTLTVYYGGAPHVALRPPWDGGFSWAADKPLFLLLKMPFLHILHLSLYLMPPEILTQNYFGHLKFLHFELTL